MKTIEELKKRIKVYGLALRELTYEYQTAQTLDRADSIFADIIAVGTEINRMSADLKELQDEN